MTIADFGGCAPPDFRFIGPLLAAGADTTAHGPRYGTPIDLARSYLYLPKSSAGIRRRASLAAHPTWGFAGALWGKALDVVELVDLAWAPRNPDSDAPLATPDEVVDDILILGGGQLDKLIAAARLAARDEDELRRAAERLR